MKSVRTFWLWVHRWGGLVMAVPLIIVALTGSIIAFDKEMRHLLTPERYATPPPGVRRLDLEVLAERALATVPPGGIINVIGFDSDRVVAVVMPRMDFAAMREKAEKKSFSLSMLFSSDPTAFMEGAPFKPFAVYIDPWTGKELDREMIGGGMFSDGIMKFVHLLHNKLALGLFGHWLLGILALLWTLDCFVSYYLTFPVARRKDSDAVASTKSWWARWKPAWKIKAKASTYRLNFDLHRANGLWLWPLLFVFAWSSVLLNLRSVYDFVTKAAFEYHSPAEHMNKEAKLALEKYKTRGEPEPDLKANMATAKRLAAEEGARQGIALGEPKLFAKLPGTSLAQVQLLLNTPACRDSSENECLVSLKFDSKTGTLVEFKTPDKDELQNEPTGNFITRWLRKLHYAHPIGLWYQIVVCITGIVIALLSGTGIYIWWKKRKARKHSEAKKAEAELAADVAT